MNIEEDIWKACETGNISRVRELVPYSVSVNEKGESGWTPLAHAICEGHLDVVKYLVSQGANLLCCTVSNQSALHIACFPARIEMMEYLILQGKLMVIDLLSVKDDRNWVPLRLAICNRQVKEAEYLILQAKSMGFDIVSMINEKDIYENGHLSSVYRYNWEARMEMMEMLITYGADVNEINETRDTLLRKVFYEDQEVARLLITHGADCSKLFEEFERDGAEDFKNMLEGLIVEELGKRIKG